MTDNIRDPNDATYPQRTLTKGEAWEAMQLRYLGDATELLQVSSGKLSTNGPDTGDRGNLRKNRGGG